MHYKSYMNITMIIENHIWYCHYTSEMLKNAIAGFLPSASRVNWSQDATEGKLYATRWSWRVGPWVQVMMEVENHPKMKGNSYWRHTHFPLNHDYGRKGIPYQHDYKHHPIWKKLWKTGHDILLYLFEQLVWTFIMTFLGFCVACWSTNEHAPVHEQNQRCFVAK